MTARRCSLLALVVGLVLAVLAGPSASAAARPVAIKLTGSGPVPLSVTISVGDQLVFVNTDNLAHRVTATKGFTFDVTVAAGKTSAPTPVFAAAGTDTYRDSRLPTVLSQLIQDVTGTVKVTAASSSSPSPSASAAPRPTSSASPRPTASGAASPKPTASGAASPKPTAAGPAPSPGTSATPAAPGSAGGAGGASGPGGTAGSGTATSPLLPGFLGGSLGTPAPAPATGPAPNVAPPVLPGSDGAVAGGPPVPGSDALVSGSTGTVGSPTAGGSLAQRSPGRHYGLPAALAVVAIAGVLSLLVRLLLSEPAALRRRSALVARRRVSIAN